MCCEVNQLLTAIWSPVAPVEQYRCPGSGDRSDHVASFTLVVHAHDRRQSYSVFENVHEVNVAALRR